MCFYLTPGKSLPFGHVTFPYNIHRMRSHTGNYYIGHYIYALYNNSPPTKRIVSAIWESWVTLLIAASYSLLTQNTQSAWCRNIPHQDGVNTLDQRGS